jgi:hypothetical protein
MVAATATGVGATLLMLLTFLVIPSTPVHLALIIGGGGLLGIWIGLSGLDSERHEVVGITIHRRTGRSEQWTATTEEGLPLVKALRETLGERVHTGEWHLPAPAAGDA